MRNDCVVDDAKTRSFVMSAGLRLTFVVALMVGCGPQAATHSVAPHPKAAGKPPWLEEPPRVTRREHPTVPKAAEPASPSLRIYHIDVEQADATLFVAPGGGTLLVDAGSAGDGARIEHVMKEAGVDKLDYFVVTHYDEAHYGGIDEVARDVEIVQAFDRGQKPRLPGATKYSAAYKAYARAVGGVAETLLPGDKIDLDPAMTVTCLSSSGGVFGTSSRASAHDENDLGISLLVEYGDFRYFVGGDIGRATEATILDGGLARDVDVYRANAHGSAAGSSKAFVEGLSPTVVIISNGNDENEPCPSRAALDTYRALATPPTVFQTNKLFIDSESCGNVADAFIADREAKDADGTILVTVTGQQYTVSYGTLRHTFEISPSARSAPKVVISSLLPDPAGSDKDLEEVTIKNESNFVVDVSRWILKDAKGDTWSLVGLGTIAPGSEKTVVRHRMRMSLNNSGDKVFLVDHNQKVVDEFEYHDSVRGKRVLTGH